jgi:hypothetical protein
VPVPAYDPTDVPHAVLPAADTWHIVGLSWRLLSGPTYQCNIDLLLQRGDETVSLRFYGAQDLEIERGGPRDTAGLTILDVRARGLERLGVRVTDFEGSHGQVDFWAHRVEPIPPEQFGQDGSNSFSE